MKKLTSERYDEFLDALNDGFNKDVSKWFSRELGHIYPSLVDGYEVDDSQMKLIESNYYIEKDGEMVSGLALYNMDMTCIVNDEKIKMKVGGIGSVFTRESERSTGLMTSNLKYAVKLLSEQEYDISWLAGDRKRYSRFGWDIAGRIYEYKISMKDLKNSYEEMLGKIADYNESIRFLNVNNDNLNRVRGLYERYGMGIERDEALWLRQINRPNLLWLVYETECESGKDLEDVQEGYFVTFEHDKSTIVEIQGDNMTTIGSLILYMKEQNLDAIKIRMPYGEETMNRLFMGIASDISIINAGMIKVVDSKRILSKIGFKLEEIKNGNQIDKIAKRKMQLWNEEIELHRDSIKWWISDIDKV